MPVKTGDYSMIQPALAYLDRMYGLKPGHVKHLNVATDAAGVTELTLTVYVQAEDLERDDERLRVVPLVKVPMRDEAPRLEPYAIGTCGLCNARIWAYGVEREVGPAGEPGRYDFTDWRGCADQLSHTPSPTLVVPTPRP